MNKTIYRMKWIKSPWTIGIGTAIFSFFLPLIYDYFKQNPFLTTFLVLFKWVSNIIWFILNYNIKVWWLLSAILAIVIVITFISLKKGKIIKPDFYNYSEDKFKQWKWTWDWEYNRNRGAWNIINMKAYCPKCDTPLIDYSNEFGKNFECPRCEYKAFYDKCDDPAKVERIILDNVEREKQNKKV